MAYTDTTNLLTPATWDALANEYLNGERILGAGDPGFANWRRLRTWVWHVTGATLGDDREADGARTVAEIRTSSQGGKVLQWKPRTDCDDVIKSFEDLEAARVAYLVGWADHLPVSDLHHDHPIFDREDNLRFRAWHDTAHLDHGLGFSANDELRLFGKQAAGLLRAYREEAVDALFCESVYQLAACIVLDGYPEQQRCVALGPVGRAVRDLLVGLA